MMFGPKSKTLSGKAFDLTIDVLFKSSEQLYRMGDGLHEFARKLNNFTEYRRLDSNVYSFHRDSWGSNKGFG